MIKYLIPLVLVLSGCSGFAPRIKDHFPIAPDVLMVAPTPLNALPDTPLTLSELVDSVKNNYAISNLTKLQLEALQEWIRAQTELYNSAK